jgi:hypothetical protein
MRLYFAAMNFKRKGQTVTQTEHSKKTLDKLGDARKKITWKLLP